MRLWHKDLIPYLPKQQLVAQWRECCLIAGLLASDHTPNHILVNPVVDYQNEHFEFYCYLIYQEMKKRGFNITEDVCHKLEQNLRAWRVYREAEVPWDCFLKDWNADIDLDLFHGWHNKRYLRQCYYNLEEKYDRGGIPENEWMLIFANFGGV